MNKPYVIKSLHKNKLQKTYFSKREQAESAYADKLRTKKKTEIVVLSKEQPSIN